MMMNGNNGSDTSVRVEINSSLVTMQVANSERVSDNSISKTGITAAREKRDRLLSLKKKKEGILKTRQFHLDIPASSTTHHTEEMANAFR